MSEHTGAAQKISLFGAWEGAEQAKIKEAGELPNESGLPEMR